METVVIVLAVIVLALIAAELGVGICFFNKSAVRKKSSLKQTQSMTGVNWQQYDPERSRLIERLDNMPHEDCYIRSKDGIKLHARYIESAAAGGIGDRKIFICFHGYTSRCIGNNTAIANFFLENGYDVLLPDLRSHGESEGDYFGFGVLDRYDGLEWIEFLRDRFKTEDEQGRLSINLYGVSMGGATVCMMSGLDLPPCVKAVISDCAFTSPKELFTRLVRTKYNMPPALVMLAGNVIYRLRAGYGLNDCSSDRAAAQQSKLPMLFIHGAEDNFIPPEMCRKIYDACGSGKKEILLVPNADHAEAYFKAGDLYESKIKEFLEI